MIKVKSIYQLIVYSIIFIIVLISFFTFIIITNAFTEFQDKIKMIEQNNLTKQKILIKEDITNTLKFIRYYHEKYKGKKSEVIIQNEVLKALDEMKSSKNINDYTFIYLFDGTSVYYPAVKERIGENLYEFTDPNGIKVIKELIDISQKKREVMSNTFGINLQEIRTLRKSPMPLPTNLGIGRLVKGSI